MNQISLPLLHPLQILNMNCKYKNNDSEQDTMRLNESLVL